MDNPIVSNPNDFKVVEFFNSTDFDFTPELGAMYDGKPLFVRSGERVHFPYHVGYRLAVNLAKAVLIKGAPLHDPNSNNPVGKPLWGEDGLNQLKESFIKVLYSEARPIKQSETDRLMAMVEELKRKFEESQQGKPQTPAQVKTVQELVAPELSQVTKTPVQAPATPPVSPEPKRVFLDKAEVIEELKKRGIKFDARSSKASLEKLLTA